MEQFFFFYGGPASQWYPSVFNLDGVEYDCAEQCMMHKKALLFGDDEIAQQIMAAKDDPKTQKALGRKVANFDEDIWNATAKLIVYRANRAKFTQNTELKSWLLSTTGKTLVEASPFDRIWGIGLAPRDPEAASRSTWQGLNWLGEIVTLVRDDISLEIT